MFLPDSMKNQADDDAASVRRNTAYKDIERWSLELIPSQIRNAVQISVQEVQCGDPECAPIDTAIAILFDSGGRGMLGLPMEAYEVNKELLREHFPYGDVLEKWAKGEEAEWPPLDLEDEMDDPFPALRFGVGQRVQCRVGPDEVTGWASGTIIQLWYRENSWNSGTYAPYKIRLDDGREIFAPADADPVVRAIP